MGKNRKEMAEVSDVLDNITENEDNRISKAEQNTSALGCSSTGKERITKAAEHIVKADKNLASFEDNDIEKLLLENERQKEERIENARRQMSENAERARKNAELGEVKTGGEYRRAFSGRDKLKEQILEQQRAFESSEKEREVRLEQLLQRENIAFSQDALSAEKEEKKTDITPNCDEPGVWHNAEELINQYELDFSDKEKANDDNLWHSASDLVPNLDDEQDASEKTGQTANSEQEDDPNKIIIKIDAYKISAENLNAAESARFENSVYTDRCADPNLFYESRTDKMKLQRQMASDAAADAAKIHEEELRRLGEEQELYNGEIQAIRAKRIELERRRASLYAYPASDEYEPIGYKPQAYDGYEPIGYKPASSDGYRPVEYSFPGFEKPTANVPYSEDESAQDLEKYADFEREREEIDEYEREFERAMQGKDFPENPYTNPANLGFDGYGFEGGSHGAQPKPEEPISPPSSDIDSREENAETFHLDRRELLRFLSKNSAHEFSLIRKIKKTERRQKKTPLNIGVNLVIERIQAYKELVQIASENLVVCIGANDKKQAARCKKKLHAYILQFNLAGEEYEILTGMSAPYIENTVADDVAMGKPCPPIPDIQYVDISEMETDAMSDEDKKAAQIEKLRFAKEYGKEMRRLAKRMKKGLSPIDSSDTPQAKRDNAKQYAERMRAVKAAKQRDELLVRARIEYSIAVLENQLNMSLYSFGVKEAVKRGEARRISAKIKRLRRVIKKAIMLEKEDNKRYYHFKLADMETEPIKKSANLERLASLRMRLDVLLSQRESINERLLSLYGRSEKHTEKKGFDAKNNEVVKRYAKSVYKSQRRLASKVEKMHAPLDLKGKIYNLMNQKTECAVEIETSKYRLKVADIRGSAKAELLRKIRKSKSRIRSIGRDIDFLIKKARKEHEDYSDKKIMGAWIIGVLIFVVVSLLLWSMFSDKIAPFLSKIAAWYNG